MKKTTRRILSLALCLTLVLTLPLAASAASTSISWRDENGAYYLSLSGTAGTRFFKYPSAQTVTHYSGDTDRVTYTGGDSVTSRWLYTQITVSSYIESCMIDLGMVNSRTATSTAGNPAVKIIYSTDLPGTYTVGTIIPFMTGTSRFSDEISYNGNTPTPYANVTGTFSGPLSSGAITNDYLMRTGST